MYHPDLIRHPDSCPALVLNADYTPLSYYPLSVWPWQTAIKAVFLDRVDIVANYEREVLAPTSAIKLPSVTGSSSHPTGTGVGAIIFRPPVMALLGTIVLLFQALLLAHGGLTTLGANVFSMAVVGPWVGYGLFRLLAAAPFMVRVFVGVAVADLATYVTTATQLALAYPEGGFVEAWGRFLGIFAVTQVPLAIVEGLVGVLLINALIAWARPEMEDLEVVPAETKEPARA